MSHSEELLNREDCLSILKNYTNDGNVIFKSHTIKELGTTEGFLGQHYKLQINYEESGEEKDVKLFLKALVTIFDTINDLSKSLRAYDREELWYEHLTKEFKSHGLCIDFTPKCYLCRPSILVLEDLALRGYRNSAKKQMLDIRHCKVALKTLAHFHASTILYEDIKSRSQDKYSNLLIQYPNTLNDVVLSDTKNLAKDWLQCTFAGLLILIDCLPEASASAEEYKSKLIEFFELPAIQPEPSTKYKNTVLHGDLWSNNFMFKYENGVPVNSVLIDYQLLKYGPMALDVVQMVMTNVRRNVRNDHYDELLSYYYHQFVEYCDEHKFSAHEFISYKDFMQSCDEFKVLAKLVSIADHSITFLVGEALDEVYKSEEEIKKFLFTNRKEIMLSSYREDEVYREILTEDLVELREMILCTV